MELSSKLVKSVAYDPSTGVLDIEIRLKGNRRYFNVPPVVYENLITATSPGWYYTRHIRDAFPRSVEGAQGSAQKLLRIVVGKRGQLS
ncbi:KTSC domain-containing protein [Rhizobium sp. WYJ-E13]|uniref:KTSC domain-containing protein n=1 Tax=Rhizobium sp. WYJ-E13 TaxID=2849093 RepID=UPI001C1EF00F|nr:KTSC domain-containing protein [Rhizobium sp. WYJ-E13]QWW70113.1 KTSC domain-containing protein [Rhizobium sp. WYJ-E13]